MKKINWQPTHTHTQIVLSLAALPALLYLALSLPSPFREGTGVGATADSAFTQSAPQQINVSIFLLGVREFDQRTGSFIADFYLNLFCQPDQTCDPTNFELTNGTILYKEDLSTADDYRTYRIQARLYANLDFHAFPFDRQVLAIVLEDKLLPREELVYLPALDETAIDQDMQIPGWELGASTATVDEHYYTSWDQFYSRYRFTIEIQRPLLSSLVKGLAPAALVALVAFFSLFISAAKSLNRLSVLTSTFIAGVLLHLNMTNAIPAVSYLTFTDRFMLANYIVIAAGLGLTIWGLGLAEAEQNERAERLNRQMRLWIPVAWLLMQAFNALLLLV